MPSSCLVIFFGSAPGGAIPSRPARRCGCRAQRRSRTAPSWGRPKGLSMTGPSTAAGWCRSVSRSARRSRRSRSAIRQQSRRSRGFHRRKGTSGSLTQQSCTVVVQSHISLIERRAAGAERPAPSRPQWGQLLTWRISPAHLSSIGSTVSPFAAGRLTQARTTPISR